MEGVLLPQPPKAQKSEWLSLKPRAAVGRDGLAQSRLGAESLSPTGVPDLQKMPVLAGLPVIVVSSTESRQFSPLQSANVGKWILAVSHQDSLEIPCEHGTSCARPAVDLSSRRRGVGARGLSIGAALHTLRHSSCFSCGRRRSPCLTVLCKFPGAIVDCPLDGPAFKLTPIHYNDNEVDPGQEMKVGGNCESNLHAQAIASPSSFFCQVQKCRATCAIKRSSHLASNVSSHVPYLTP